jgi:predicted nucleic acid-binding protein
MSAKCFLDTNIFAYSFDAHSPGKAASASKLIKRAIETRRGIVSYQVVQEFFSVALRRLGKPMTEPKARQYLSVTFCPLLSVCSTLGLYGDALASPASLATPGVIR